MIIALGSDKGGLRIKEHIRKLKKVMSVNGGYILAPAKPFQPETPVENAIAVIDAMIEG